MEDQLSRAKALIQAKQYDQARAILSGMDHPTAHKWLAKIDEMDNPFDVTPTSSNSSPSIATKARRRMRGFKTRQRIFWVLAALSLGWILLGFTATSDSVENAQTQNTAQTEAEQAAFEVGVGLGAGIGLTIFLCSGGFFFIIFALMAWRNGVGYRAEEHILETVTR